VPPPAGTTPRTGAPAGAPPHHDPATGGFRNPWPGAEPHGSVGDLLRWVVLERLLGVAPRADAGAPAAAREDGGQSNGASNSAGNGAGNGGRTRPGPTPEAFRLAFPAAVPSFATPRAAADALTATWVGHSTFLLQVGGLNVLTDPVWSERASPVSFAGPRRWTPPGVSFDALPPIDVVLVSHDHYDHLDEPTVRRLVREHPGAHWLAPLGVARWLRKRGAGSVAEHDWWESAEILREGVTARATCVPAQHFSGRSAGRRNDTLWCGWTLRAGERAVYYVGDTGYFPELGECARRGGGPFDLVLMPVGAYDPRWFMRPVHNDPEDAVRAYRDVVAGTRSTAAAAAAPPPVMGAMHWGTFKLTDEPMDEPPRRTREAWERAGLPAELLWVPAFGETKEIGE
jgi:N-acyl-phosphatidylethanolamine-hydrolysing phospholipase D